MQFGDRRAIVSVVIPCLDEESAIGEVVVACLSLGVDEVVVVDGGSADRTVERAEAAGARVTVEPRHGYGRACATGVKASRPDCEVLVFIDGDGSDVPAFLPSIAGPVVDGQADFVMGSRLRGKREPNSLTPQQIVAGLLAGALLRLVYGVRMSDMSPFRAIRRDMLLRLGMYEMSYGWNLEMQMRAAAAGLRVIEIPVDHRRRQGGVSKVSGNLRAGLAAAATVCATFLRLALALQGSGGQSQRALGDAGPAHDAAPAKQRVGAERPSRGIKDE